MSRKLPALILLGLLATACGDDELIPPVVPDALDEGDPAITTASPLPGVYRDGVAVTLTADEPATIYYTLDGTTPTTSSAAGASPLVLDAFDASTEVRFFALDSDGDEEAEHGATYVIDRLGPAPVALLGATYAGIAIDVTWTPPVAPGFVDVVLVETDDVAATLPAFGSDISVGDPVGSGTVVYAGITPSFSPATAIPGAHTYVAFARYDTGTYSEGRVTSIYVDRAETAQVVVDLTGNTVTVPTQAQDVGLTAANLAFNTGTVTFDLTATSAMLGNHFNSKLVVTTLSSGTFVGDGTIVVPTALAGAPVRDLGPAAWASGAVVTRTITITGVTAGATVTLDLTILRDRGVYAATTTDDATDGGGFLADRATASARVGLPRPAGFTPPLTTGYVGAAVSPDARYLYGGVRNAGRVDKIELATGAVVDELTATIAGTSGAIGDLRLDPSGRRLYAVLTDSTAGGGVVILLEIDPATMTEVDRLVLASGGAGFTGRRLDVARGARYAAVVEGAPEVIHVIDLTRWTIRDADPNTAGAQGLVPPPELHPDAIAFDPSGTYLVCNGSATDDRIGQTDLTEAALRMTVRDQDGEAGTATSQIRGFVPIPGAVGGFWLLGDLATLTRFNPITGQFSVVGATAFDAVAARLSADGTTLDVTSQVELGSFDTSTGVYTMIAPWPGTADDHALAITPY